MKRCDVGLRREALLDLEEIATYIESDSDAAADRVLAKFHDALDHLREMPKMGAAWPVKNRRLKDLRHWVITDFGPFIIFYVAKPGKIEIVRVLHGARDIERILNEETF